MDLREDLLLLLAELFVVDADDVVVVDDRFDSAIFRPSSLLSARFTLAAGAGRAFLDRCLAAAFGGFLCAVRTVKVGRERERRENVDTCVR